MPMNCAIDVGNSTMDTHDGGPPTSWVWTSCQSFIGGVQDAFEGNLPMFAKDAFS